VDNRKSSVAGEGVRLREREGRRERKSDHFVGGLCHLSVESRVVHLINEREVKRSE
jgi:hypothetical protein